MAEVNFGLCYVHDRWFLDECEECKKESKESIKTSG